MKSDVVGRALAIAAVVLAASTYTLISIGGLVRNAGAGLACPDWPLCHGQLVPSQMLSATASSESVSLTGSHSTPIGQAPVQVFLEWFHRMIAGLVSLLLVGLSAFVAFSPRYRPPLLGPCLLALVLLLAQVVLGGLTVLGILSPKWVTSHLAVGLGFFAVLVVIALRFRSLTPVRGNKNSAAIRSGGLKWYFVVAAAAVYIQAVLGGLVSSNYAGLACPDFPKCLGSWWPIQMNLSWLAQKNVALHYVHRIGALVLTLYLGGLLGYCLWTQRLNVGLRRALWASGALLGVQVALGVSMVWLQIPLLASVGHLAVAAALWGLQVMVAHELG